MEGVSEDVDRFAFYDCESDTFHKSLDSNNKVRFVYMYSSSVFVVGTKTSKTGCVCMAGAEHNFVTEDQHLSHKPQAFFSCFGQDAALKSP